MRNNNDFPNALCSECLQGLPLNDQKLNEYITTRPGTRKVILVPVHDEDPVSIVLDYKRADTAPNFPTLQQAVDSGCRFCCCLMKAMKGREYAGPAPATILYQYIWYPNAENSEFAGLRFLEVRLVLDGGRKGSHNFFFTINTDQEDLVKWLLINPSPGDVALSPRNIEIIRQKLTDSVNKCCPLEATTNSYLPARLLDIGTTTNPTSKIILTEQFQNRASRLVPQYAALSYCWGPKIEADQNLQTRNLSLPLFLTAINHTLFPAVIKDTILVCRALSIRYLWVDTLCIIQDDLADWQKESQNMGLVYLNALVTICPLSSASCLQGFLDRPVNDILIPFQSRLNTRVRGTYKLEYQPTITVPTEDIDIALDIDKSRWSKRGWTLQELYMSCRILYFGQSRFHFQCAHEGFSEDLGCQRYSYIEPLPEALKSSEIKHEDLYDKWYQMAAHYCQRDLTKVEDKLPAISGLASFFAKHIKEDYIVGLWKGDIMRGLIWYGGQRDTRDNHIRRLSSPKPANLPSWSCLAHGSSFEVGVQNIPLYDVKLFAACTILPHIKLASSNPFGPINKAALSVSGKYISLSSELHRAQRDGFTYPSWDMKVRGSLVFQCELDFSYDAQRFRPPSGTILFKISTSARPSRPSIQAVWGLVLIPAQYLGDYYRIGVFSTHPSSTSSVDLYRTVGLDTIRIV